MNRLLLQLMLVAACLVATACGRYEGAPPPPDLQPVGDGLQVIGFALVAAAVVVSLGLWFRKSN